MTEQLWEVIEEPIPIHKCAMPPLDAFPIRTVIRCTVCRKEYLLASDPFGLFSPNSAPRRWIRRMPK